MTRNEVLKKLYTMAIEISRQYKLHTYCKMWDLCNDWNASHAQREEIFMCEDYDENDKFRFFIEDDYFYPSED